MNQPFQATAPVIDSGAIPNHDQPLIIDREQSTEGVLTIHTQADQAVTVTSTGRWQHQGEINLRAEKSGLLLKSGAQASITGKLQTCGQTENGISLAANSQLTLEGELLAEGKQQAMLLAEESRFNLTGQGGLKLSKLTAAPGSHFCIQGDYQIEIDQLSYPGDDFSTKPAQLAFQLQPYNRLHIKQFNLPAAKEAPLATGITPRAPIQITVNGQPLDIHFDVKTLNINHALPQTYLYQSAAQQSPVEMSVAGSSDWQLPGSAQLIQQLSVAGCDEINRMTEAVAIADQIAMTAATNDNFSSLGSYLELPF